MTTPAKNARTAGLLYLLIILVGPLRLIYIPTTLFVSDNATATAANITAHESLFRFGMAADVFCAVVLIYVVMALARLFKGVDEYQSRLMVIFGGVLPVASYFFNVANDAVTLMLVRGGGFLTVFDKPQRDALAMLFLRLRDYEIVAAETLWGLWLVPLAILIYKSRMLPRALAIWLLFNGGSYLALSFTGMLMPQYQDIVFRLGSPARFGELAFVLWLVIMAAKPQQPAASVWS